MEKIYWLFNLFIGIIAGLFIGWGDIVTTVAVGLIVGVVAITWTALKIGIALGRTVTTDILFDTTIIMSIVAAIVSQYNSGFNLFSALFALVLFAIVFGIIAFILIVFHGDRYVLTDQLVRRGD